MPILPPTSGASATPQSLELPGSTTVSIRVRTNGGTATAALRYHLDEEVPVGFNTGPGSPVRKIAWKLPLEVGAGGTTVSKELQFCRDGTGPSSELLVQIRVEVREIDEAGDILRSFIRSARVRVR